MLVGVWCEPVISFITDNFSIISVSWFPPSDCCQKRNHLFLVGVLFWKIYPVTAWCEEKGLEDDRYKLFVLFFRKIALSMSYMPMGVSMLMKCNLWVGNFSYCYN